MRKIIIAATLLALAGCSSTQANEPAASAPTSTTAPAVSAMSEPTAEQSTQLVAEVLALGVDLPPEEIVRAAVATCALWANDDGPVGGTLDRTVQAVRMQFARAGVDEGTAGKIGGAINRGGWCATS